MIKLLFNPFEDFLERKLLLFGSVTLICGSFIGYVFKGRYDGVLDVHFVDQIRIHEPFVDLLIGIACATLLLYILGYSINKKTRWIDVLITVIIAKIPFYLLPFLNFNNGISVASNKIIQSLTSTVENLNLTSNEIVLLVISSILSLLALVWSVILLFNGYKTATNSKEIKHTLFFIVVLIISEFLSKVVITLIN